MERSFGLLAFKSIVDCHLLSTVALLLQLFVLTHQLFLIKLVYRRSSFNLKEAIQT